MGDDPYLATRVRAMRARLLDPARLDALAASPDLPALGKALRRTPYAGVIERAGGAEDVAAIEEGLRREFRASVMTLRAAASGRRRVLIDLLLLRWEAANLKAIVRGRVAGSPAEEILAGCAPIGWSDEPALAELARQPSLAAVVETVTLWRHPFARPLAAAIGSQRPLIGAVQRAAGVPDDRINLDAVERALDRSWFDEARRTLGPTAAYWCRSTDEDDRALAAYFGWLIDLRNLLEAVRAHQEGERAAVAVFAEGGIDVDRTLFDRVLRAADWAAVSDLISGTRYGSVSIVGGGGHPPVTQAERQLTSALIRRLDGLARPNPLGFALVIGSFERKANEVATLRMIAQGVAYGMAPDEIRALVAA